MFYWVSTYSCSLHLHLAATVLLDMVQVLQPVVDATVYQGPWTDLADARCSEFISSYRFNSGVSLWSLSAAGRLSHATSTHTVLLFSLQFSGNCFSTHLHRYQQNPRAHSHRRGLLHEFNNNRTIALNLCHILFLYG